MSLSSFRHRDLVFLHKFVSAVENNIDNFELNNAISQTSLDRYKQGTKINFKVLNIISMSYFIQSNILINIGTYRYYAKVELILIFKL